MHSLMMAGKSLVTQGHDIPACVDTGPWPGPELLELELELGRLLALLGRLPIAPQQTLRSTLHRDLKGTLLWRQASWLPARIQTLGPHREQPLPSGADAAGEPGAVFPAAHLS